MGKRDGEKSRKKGDETDNIFAVEFLWSGDEGNIDWELREWVNEGNMWERNEKEEGTTGKDASRKEDLALR